VLLAGNRTRRRHPGGALRESRLDPADQLYP